MNKDIAGNTVEFYSNNETLAGLVIKLNKGYKLNVVQACAPTPTLDDQLVESFYEDVDTAIIKLKTQYTVLMRDFKAEVGEDWLETTR